ncbi:MAG: lamin tail domain-containing protein [Bacteroidota bacterium]
MKNIFFILLLLPFFATAQITDDFSDGDFTNNPTWSGDASQFIVNGSQQLQLNSTALGSSYLSVGNNSPSLANTTWQFYIHLNFAPSSGNYARVYLVSDKSNLEGSLNGYYLQFGETGTSDAIELFKQTGTSSTSVARGTNGFIANIFTVSVKVTRDNAGLWSILADPAAGTNFVLQATGTDNSITTSTFFGLLCYYSVSNIANFFFDDFVFPFTPDVIPPIVSNINVISQNQVDVIFNELVEQTSSETIFNYSVNNGIGNPAAATRDASDFSTVHLTFALPFASGIENTLSVLNVKDIYNNPIVTASTGIFTYYTVDTAALSDIILNEILYAPTETGAEFIEIYNRSQKVIDLFSLRICEVDRTDNSLSTPIEITTTKHLILPGEYIVLTDDPDAVKSNYQTPNPDGFIKVSGFPSLNNDGDDIAIIDTDSLRIDQFNYSPGYQFSLLNDDVGISLERISFNRPTQDSSNWHSAAETVGFATPAYENSQHAEVIDDGSEVSVEPEIFSPDNDGHDDVININFHFGEPGYIANLKIYDSKGREIIHLVKNQLLGIDGSFIWDGISSKNEKAKVGIYVAYLEIFNEKGTVKKFKKPIVLASKL